MLSISAAFGPLGPLPFKDVDQELHLCQTIIKEAEKPRPGNADFWSPLATIGFCILFLRCFFLSQVTLCINFSGSDVRLDQLYVILKDDFTDRCKPIFVEPHYLFLCPEKFHLLRLHGNVAIWFGQWIPGSLPHGVLQAHENRPKVRWKNTRTSAGQVPGVCSRQLAGCQIVISTLQPCS